MLALKKKREAEAKAKAAASAEEQAAGTPTATPEMKKVSLFGVGGKKKQGNGEGKTTGKKRTPGEIRIQKGKQFACTSDLPSYEVLRRLSACARMGGRKRTV